MLRSRSTTRLAERRIMAASIGSCGPPSLATIVTTAEEHALTESSAASLGRWRLGIHPGATGARVRSLGRVDLPLGEALRLELELEGPGDGAVVNLQYYVCTDAGGWALWLACPGNELAAREAALGQLAPPFMNER